MVRSLTAFEKAEEMYSETDLQYIMSFCASYGFVYCDKELFLCAYPTNHELIEIKSKKELDIADTWYVYIATGSIKKAFSVIEPLKYVAFRRMDDRFRLIEFEKLRRRFV